MLSRFFDLERPFGRIHWNQAKDSGMSALDEYVESEEIVCNGDLAKRYADFVIKRMPL